MDFISQHKPVAIGIVLLILATTVFTSLSNFDEKNKKAAVLEGIKGEENINTNIMNNELKIEDVVVGTGKEAVAGSVISVNYVGKFTDGKLFDTNSPEAAKAGGVYNPQRPYEAFEFNLGAGQVIAGWDQGVVGMKVGGKRMLTIPSDLAYGPNDYGPIPGGSTLIFEVELLDVK